MSVMRKILYIQILSGVLLSALFFFIPSPAAAAPRKAPVRISPLSDSLRKVSKLPDAAARAAFNNFAKKTGTAAWRVRYSPKTALPEAIVGAKTRAYSGTPEEAALSFLKDNKDLLKVDIGQLRKAYSKVFMGVTHIQFEQFYNSVPVEFAYVRVHVDPSGKVIGYQSKFEPNINLPLAPSLPSVYAENAVLSDLGLSARVTGRALVLFPDQNADGALKLAWKVRARASNTASGVWVYYVSAKDGKILFRYNDLRYVCSPSSNASGTVTGAVYPISPLPTGNSKVNTDTWIQPVLTTPINNQYVWITSDLKTPASVVSGENGEYCGTSAGKVFASLKGPYFSVTNFRGLSAHFDNGGGVWQTTKTVVDCHPPYTKYDYTITVSSDIWSDKGQAFAKVMPHFSSFSVGEMDLDGNITDPDEVDIKDQNERIVASYIGTRSQPFLGAAVESTTYHLTLDINEGGTPSGFSVDVSSYLVLTDHPLVSDNANGNIVWANNQKGVLLDNSLGKVENSYAEANAFYHLNAAYEYFKHVNQDSLGNQFADLSSRQVPVMVHAHGEADTISDSGGMRNGFYDLEKDSIFLGDGMRDDFLNYRSFALDGTIIRHEYTHRVVNKIYPIINFGEFGAISEAMADYFSLASFAKEGKNISVLGNFAGAGEGLERDLAVAATLPVNWTGEVHEDSLILSRALWQLRKSTSTNLGYFGAGDRFPNMPKADVFAYAALFYFPDNFANFYDAFVDACEHLDPGCSSLLPNIKKAFDDHGIFTSTFTATSTSTYVSGTDPYDQPGLPLCDNNNGPECATDISTMTWLSATIFPAGDVDYYALPLQAGSFTAALTMPAKDPDSYYAYALSLFDANRKIAQYPDVNNDRCSDRSNGCDVIALPVVSYTPSGYCPQSGECLTNSPSVSFSYNVLNPGRYYLSVFGSIIKDDYGNLLGNSGVSSTIPYTLNLSYAPKGTASAQISVTAYDQDTISFTVPCPEFQMQILPSTPTITYYPNAEFVFAYAQLRDHNFQPLADTRTDLFPNSLLYYDGPAYYTEENGKTVIAGKVRLNSAFTRHVSGTSCAGFAGCYPGVGTVYLEVFGRNHMGNVISLGVSSAINLTTNKSDLITYNNIIKSSSDRTIVKYDLQSGGKLTIKIYTVTGNLIKTVFSGVAPAGKGTIDWDGTNSGGAKVASGIYYIKANGPGLNKTDKIAVVR